MGQPAKWDQDSFRVRNDNGSESAATWVQNANIDATLDVDTNYRIRFLIDNFGGTDGSVVAQLQYNLNSAGWNNVTSSSSVVKSVLSSYFADADSTTQQVGSGTFNAGEMDESSGVTGSISVPYLGIQETEVEFCFQIVSGDVVDADSIQLRLINSGAVVYDTYTNTPTITVNEASGSVTVTPSGGAIDCAGAQPTVAAQAFYDTDFSEYTASAQPSDWTHRWATGSAYTAETGGDIGTKLLQQALTSENVAGLSWDDVGSVADVEILSKSRLHNNTSTIDYGAGLFVRGSGAAGATYAYHVSLDLGGQVVNIGKNLNGSYSAVVSSVAFTFTYDQWVWIRFRVIGTSIKVKWWLDGNSEPGSWNVDTTDSNISAAGWTGVYTYDGIDDQYDWFSIATDGGTAASPPAGTTAEPTGHAIPVVGAQPTVTTTEHKTANPSGHVVEVAGAQPTITTNTNVQPSGGAVSVDGSQPVVRTNTNIAPAGHIVPVAGAQPTVVATAHKTVEPLGHDIPVVGAQPTITATAHKTVDPLGHAIPVVGAQPTVATAANVTVQPAGKEITVAGAQPTVTATAHKTVDPAGHVISVVGAQPTVTAAASVTVQPAGKEITVAGAQPTVSAANHVIVEPANASISMAGAQPTVSTTQHLIIHPASLGIEMAGAQPTIATTEHKWSQPSAASISTVGAQPTITTTTHSTIAPSGAAISIDGGQPTISGAVEYFIRDTFTDTNGTLLSAHTGETGASWTLHPSYFGTLEIQNGIAEASSGASGHYYASGTPSSAYYHVIGQFKIPSGTTSGYMCITMHGSPSAAHYWYLVYYNASNTWKLRRRYDSITYDVDTWVDTNTTEPRTIQAQIKYTADGVEGWVEGVKQLTGSVAEPTVAGVVGIIADDDGVVGLDWIEAYENNDKSVSPGSAAISVAGAQPTVTIPNETKVEPAGHAVVITGAQPTISKTIHALCQPVAANIDVAGAQPTIINAGEGLVEPTAATVSVAGAQPTIEVTEHCVTLPSAAEISVGGGQPNVMNPVAFPGAVGWGDQATGGRGGTIYKVTNLNDSGAGSLRAAIEASGARIVVFEVSGNIDLASDITISNPNISIYGQTAPYPGITMRYATLTVSASNVIVQHLTVLIGDQTNTDPGIADGIQVIGASTEKVIVDHCLFAWSIDEVGSTWYGPTDITYMNCIFLEGLENSLHPDGYGHSCGFLSGDHTHNLTLYGNLWVSSDRRMPRIKGDSWVQIVNNAFYNMGGLSGYSWCACGYVYENPAPTLVSLVGNHFKAGQNTPENNEMVGWSDSVDGNAMYTEDNIRPDAYGESQYDVSSPPIWHTSITPLPASAVEAFLVANVGPRPAQRSALAWRAINDYVNNTGAIIDSQTEVGGYPSVAENYAAFSTPVDPWDDDDKDGYTNVENYIYTNYTVPVEQTEVTIVPVGHAIPITGGQPVVNTTGEQKVIPAAAVIQVDGGAASVDWAVDYFDTFGDNAVDVGIPDNWTARFDAIGSESIWSVAETGGDNRSAKLTWDEGLKGPHAISFDEIGTPNIVEILYRTKLLTLPTAKWQGLAALCARGAAGSHTVFFVGFYGAKFSLSRNVSGGSYYEFGYTATNHAQYEEWYVRFRVESGGNLKAKAWKIADSEPGSWQITGTDATNYDNGWVCLYGYDCDVQFDWVSLSVNGGTASFPPEGPWVRPAGASISVDGGQPTIAVSDNKLLQPAGAEVSVAGAQPTISQSWQANLMPSGAEISVSGAQPQVQTSENPVAYPTAGTISVAGAQPTITKTVHALINPASSEVTVAGAKPSVVAENITVTYPEAAEITVAGGQPVISTKVSPAAAEISVTGAKPHVEMEGTKVVRPSSAEISVSGGLPFPYGGELCAGKTDMAVQVSKPNIAFTATTPAVGFSVSKPTITFEGT